MATVAPSAAEPRGRADVARQGLAAAATDRRGLHCRRCLEPRRVDRLFHAVLGGADASGGDRRRRPDIRSGSRARRHRQPAQRADGTRDGRGRAGHDPQRLRQDERYLGHGDRPGRHPARHDRRVRRGAIVAERGVEGPVTPLDPVAPGARPDREPGPGHRLRLRPDGVARRQRRAHRPHDLPAWRLSVAGSGAGRARFPAVDRPDLGAVRGHVQGAARHADRLARRHRRRRLRHPAVRRRQVPDRALYRQQRHRLELRRGRGADRAAALDLLFGADLPAWARSSPAPGPACSAAAAGPTDAESVWQGDHYWFDSAWPSPTAAFTPCLRATLGKWCRSWSVGDTEIGTADETRHSRGNPDDDGGGRRQRQPADDSASRCGLSVAAAATGNRSGAAGDDGRP